MRDALDMTPGEMEYYLEKILKWREKEANIGVF
jgi:hypothetical protein